MSVLSKNYTLNNGVEIPKLGLGTWFIDDADAADAVRAAVATGYRHIDIIDPSNTKDSKCRTDQHPDRRTIPLHLRLISFLRIQMDIAEVRQLDRPSFILQCLFRLILLRHYWEILFHLRFQVRRLQQDIRIDFVAIPIFIHPLREISRL